MAAPASAKQQLQEKEPGEQPCAFPSAAFGTTATEGGPFTPFSFSAAGNPPTFPFSFSLSSSSSAAPPLSTAPSFAPSIFNSPFSFSAASFSTLPPASFGAFGAAAATAAPPPFAVPFGQTSQPSTTDEREAVSALLEFNPPAAVFTAPAPAPVPDRVFPLSEVSPLIASVAQRAAPHFAEFLAHFSPAPAAPTAAPQRKFFALLPGFGGGFGDGKQAYKQAYVPAPSRTQQLLERLEREGAGEDDGLRLRCALLVALDEMKKPAGKNELPFVQQLLERAWLSPAASAPRYPHINLRHPNTGDTLLLLLCRFSDLELSKSGLAHLLDWACGVDFAATNNMGQCALLLSPPWYTPHPWYTPEPFVDRLLEAMLAQRPSLDLGARSEDASAAGSSSSAPPPRPVPAASLLSLACMYGDVEHVRTVLRAAPHLCLHRTRFLPLHGFLSERAPRWTGPGSEEDKETIVALLLDAMKEQLQLREQRLRQEAGPSASDSASGLTIDGALYQLLLLIVQSHVDMLPQYLQLLPPRVLEVALHTPRPHGLLLPNPFDACSNEQGFHALLDVYMPLQIDVRVAFRTATHHCWKEAVERLLTVYDMPPDPFFGDNSFFRHDRLCRSSVLHPPSSFDHTVADTSQEFPPLWLPFVLWLLRHPKAGPQLDPNIDRLSSRGTPLLTVCNLFRVFRGSHAQLRRGLVELVLLLLERPDVVLRTVDGRCNVFQCAGSCPPQLLLRLLGDERCKACTAEELTNSFQYSFLYEWMLTGVGPSPDAEPEPMELDAFERIVAAFTGVGGWKAATLDAASVQRHFPKGRLSKCLLCKILWLAGESPMPTTNGDSLPEPWPLAVASHWLRLFCVQSSFWGGGAFSLLHMTLSRLDGSGRPAYAAANVQRVLDVIERMDQGMIAAVKEGEGEDFMLVFDGFTTQRPLTEKAKRERQRRKEKEPHAARFDQLFQCMVARRTAVQHERLMEVLHVDTAGAVMEFVTGVDEWRAHQQEQRSQQPPTSSSSSSTSAQF